jgi:hypothetical protein
LKIRSPILSPNNSPPISHTPVADALLTTRRRTRAGLAVMAAFLAK